MTKPTKVPWNLSVPADIKRAMEVHCAISGEEISEVTEKLWRDLLRKEGAPMVQELASENPPAPERKPTRYTKPKKKH
jgi:hypothetical protein